MRPFGCSRFRRLAGEKNDRSLTDRESRFFEAHRAQCAQCRMAETQGAMALSMLRMSSIDAEVTPGFEDRVLRRHKVQKVHSSLQFWSPAIIGAAVAGVVVLAGLQIVVNSSKLPAWRPPNGEARRTFERNPAFPELFRTTDRSSLR